MAPRAGSPPARSIGFIFLTYRFLEPIAEFTEVIDQTQTAVAGLRRVLGILEIPIGPPEPRAPARAAGRARSASTSITSRSPTGRGSDEDDDRRCCVDVTARIPAGQQVALVGETGSGKTTLGRLIARLADPDRRRRSDSVACRCTHVANVELRERLVVVPQEPFLFDGTHRQQPRLRPPDAVGRRRRAGRASTLELGDWSRACPTASTPRSASAAPGCRPASGSSSRCVRASLVDPDVLVLDEATSSVDALTEVRLARALDKLAAGRTTISIAHRLSTAARADRVLVLEHGRLVQDGPHAELRRARGPVRPDVRGLGGVDQLQPDRRGSVDGLR